MWRFPFCHRATPRSSSIFADLMFHQQKPSTKWGPWRHGNKASEMWGPLGCRFTRPSQSGSSHIEHIPSSKAWQLSIEQNRELMVFWTMFFFFFSRLSNTLGEDPKPKLNPLERIGHFWYSFSALLPKWFILRWRQSIRASTLIQVVDHPCSYRV